MEDVQVIAIMAAILAGPHAPGQLIHTDEHVADALDLWDSTRKEWKQKNS